ncbi:MAG: hypothetical protein WH035_08070 [Spirochaetota bacterium]
MILKILFFLFFFNIEKAEEIQLIYTDPFVTFILKDFGEIQGYDLMTNLEMKKESRTIIPNYGLKLPFSILLGNEQICILKYKGLIFKIQGYNIVNFNKDFIQEFNSKENKYIIKGNINSDIFKKKHLCKFERKYEDSNTGIFVLRRFIVSDKYSDILTKVPYRILKREGFENVEIAKLIGWDGDCLYISDFFKPQKY